MSLTTGGNGHEPHYKLPDPQPGLGPDDVVRTVLSALQHNDDPGLDCGIRTAFNFASSANRAVTGPISSFAEMVKGPPYDVLIDFLEANLEPVMLVGEHARLVVRVTARNGKTYAFVWELTRQTKPPFQDCWMTDSVLPAD